MKKIIWYSVVIVLIALGLSYVMEWTFWKVFIFLATSYAVYELHATHPRIAKTVLIAAIVTFICGWVWSWFKGEYPATYQTLPYAQKQREVEVMRKIDDGLSDVKLKLLLELRKKEDKLAADVPALMQAGKHELVITQAQELIDLRKEIEKLLAQTSDPEPPAKSKVVSYTVNKDEVISTLSVPDNSTVYIEADKAFCILERYGINDDGSEKLSRLTVHPGKSSKHFPWGGAVRVIGLYDNTTLKLHL